ncbi:kinesin-like protein KIF20A [Thrips palmi]|uniref:Kinesin-like protein KIF20A n=1 Tax=Thrips palmi TaxID=161013 RepID=A0A6P9AAJ2_THRPL|nr:kinesin-like protein KIF20A [Thrips palmi]
MSLNSGALEQASFLHPRDPSITGWDQRLRFVDPVRKQLFDKIFEEEDENAKPEKNCISTYLRLKPCAVASEQATLTILNERTVGTNAPKDSVAFKNSISARVVHQYSFSKVFGPDTSQKELFDECVAFQVKDFILGSNCLVFAYGTTNAGKTYTVQGSGTSPGLIPRAIDALFKSIQGQVAGVGLYKPDKVEGLVQLDSLTISQELDYKNRILQWNWDKPFEPIKAGSNVSPNISANSESDFISNTYREMQKTISNDSPFDMANDSDVVYGVWISFAEVYNESIFDLLDPMVTRNRKRIPLRLAQDAEGSTYVRDLRMIHVSSGDEAFHIMHYGKANLQVAATNMNMRSSRSHCIFTIRLVRYANSDNPSYAIVSSFSFCDLAGAERAKKTLNAGDRLKESNNINTSLHVLGRCLATIRENQKKHDKKPVPFRDSKLTRIFQRALTGHERITMIVAANTSPVLFDETLNVLKFSAIAKQIVLETPIKKVKRKKKSRFSILASQPHATILWDAPPQDADTSISTVASSDDCVQKYNARNEELIQLVDKLKAQLVEEREKNLNLERDVRASVTETFSKIITDMENTWKAKLEDLEERNEQRSSWRIAQVEKYYQQKLESSRKRSRRDSEDDSSILICDSPEKDGRIQELEKEIELLKEKCSAVHQLLREAQDIQSSLSSDVSSLKFELANANSELEKAQRQLTALDRQSGGAEGALSKELQLQLAAEMKKNETLRDLLNEAKQDIDAAIREKEETDQELINIQSELVNKEYELAESNRQLELSGLMHSKATEELNKVEAELERLSKAHGTSVKGMNDISSILKEQEKTVLIVEELQSQLELLKVSDEESATATSDSEGPKSLTSVTQCALDTLKLKLQHFANRKSEMKSLLQAKEDEVAALKSEMKSLLQVKEDEVTKSQQYLSEAQAMKLQLQALENTVQEQVATINSLTQDRNRLENEMKQMSATISLNMAQKDTDSSCIKHLQDEIKRLEKDLKSMLQKNIAAEQQLKDTQSELESSQNSSTRLEQELKSVLQKSATQLNSSVASQSEIETLGSKVKNYEDTMKFLDKWKEENEQLKKELKEAQLEIQTREKLLNEKDLEVESIQTHRQELISRYDDAYKSIQEELEREKREVVRLRDTLYNKSTPTPKKNSNTEIKHYKDLVESLQAELSKYKMRDEQPSGKKPPRSARKAKQESISSNESLKENSGDTFSVPVAASKSKKTAAVECEHDTSSNSKMKLAEEAPAEPEIEVKPKRKTRRLFSRTQSQYSNTDCDEIEALEVDGMRGTTPEGFVRSLRNRKI